MTKLSKEDFCKVDGYRCLMPIEYELIEEHAGVSTYRKIRCNCHNVKDGKCDQEKSCSHFISADEIVKV